MILSTSPKVRRRNKINYCLSLINSIMSDAQILQAVNYNNDILDNMIHKAQSLHDIMKDSASNFIYNSLIDIKINTNLDNFKRGQTINLIIANCEFIALDLNKINQELD